MRPGNDEVMAGAAAYIKKRFLFQTRCYLRLAYWWRWTIAATNPQGTMLANVGIA
jgi:hypothetical protein